MLKWRKKHPIKRPQILKQKLFSISWDAKRVWGFLKYDKTKLFFFFFLRSLFHNSCLNPQYSESDITFDSRCCCCGAENFPYVHTSNLSTHFPKVQPQISCHQAASKTVFNVVECETFLRYVRCRTSDMTSIQRRWSFSVVCEL